MNETRRRKLLRGIALATIALLLGGGLWAGLNWSWLEVKYTSYRLRNAQNEDERCHWAHKLIDSGDLGIKLLIAALGEEASSPLRGIAIETIGKQLEKMPPGESRPESLDSQIIDSFVSGNPSTRDAVLTLLPTLLKRGTPNQIARCRDITLEALKAGGIETRLLAIRIAMNPLVRARKDLLPLLEVQEVEVRRAALFAIGPAADDEPVIGDEELFRWLHDSDTGVRTICHDALVSRGRSEGEIALCRRLSDPLVGERLKLLLDLRYEDDPIDPEPWLERLSRDVDPSVRAGAVRVAVALSGERKQPAPRWVADLADSDPDATVRRIANFYRSQSGSEVIQTSGKR